VFGRGRGRREVKETGEGKRRGGGSRPEEKKAGPTDGNLPGGRKRTVTGVGKIQPLRKLGEKELS